MAQSKLIPATAVVVIVLSGIAAALVSFKKAENSQEMMAIMDAKITLAQAITAAEQETGGRAMQIGMEHEKGAYLYEIKALSKGDVIEVFVDPMTEKITRQENQGLIAKYLDSHNRDEFAKLASSLSLANATTMAERQTGGTAIEAAFESEDGIALFEVKIAKDNATQLVKINAAFGQTLNMSAISGRDRHRAGGVSGHFTCLKSSAGCIHGSWGAPLNI